MKLTTTTMVTVDGVMQGLGGPEEDRHGGFARGGWIVPYADDETMGFLNQVYARADAFLFGRRTYEIFAGYWGAMPDPGNNPIWEALNTTPKYVASTTLADPEWAKTTVLAGEVAAAVGELKAKRGQAGDGCTWHVCLRPEKHPAYVRQSQFIFGSQILFALGSLLARYFTKGNPIARRLSPQIK